MSKSTAPVPESPATSKSSKVAVAWILSKIAAEVMIDVSSSENDSPDVCTKAPANEPNTTEEAASWSAPTASSAIIACSTASFAIVTAPVSAIVASPDITLSIHLDVPVSYSNIAPSAGVVILVSLAPATVEVVDRNESVPLPSVPSTWFAEPSAPGSVYVTLEATLLGDFKPTKCVPLSESSSSFNVAPVEEPLPTKKSAGVAVEPARISV